MKVKGTPVIEMGFNAYAHLQVYRNQKSLKIFIHVNTFHSLQQFRFGCMIAQMMYHLKILGAPNHFTIFVSWDEIHHPVSVQIINALHLCKNWTPSPIFKLQKIQLEET